nr:MAG TPA: hypothetical protein [Caudoviricetes sp.]
MKSPPYAYTAFPKPSSLPRSVGHWGLDSEKKRIYFSAGRSFRLIFRSRSAKSTAKPVSPTKVRRKRAFLLTVFYLFVKGSLFSGSILCNILSDPLKKGATKGYKGLHYSYIIDNQ